MHAWRANSGLSGWIVRLTGCTFSYDLKYYYAFDKVLHDQEDGAESRARQVIDIEGELPDMYDELTVAAAKSGDRGIALRALPSNPLVAPCSIAEPLLAALLAANRDKLPRFYRAG